MKRVWEPVLGLLAGFLAAGVLLWAVRPPQGVAITLRPPPSPAPLVVDVEGAVASPGVYTLPPGSRVRDALEAAGGLLPQAERSALNLAAPLEDGSRLRVPAVPPTATALPPGMPSTPAAGAPPPAGESAALVDINHATQAELESLPGIGPALAERIIAYRQEHGPFARIEDIQLVSGIGPATFERIRTQITVTP